MNRLAQLRQEVIEAQRRLIEANAALIAEQERILREDRDVEWQQLLLSKH